MIVEYVKAVNLDLLENAYNTGILHATDYTKDFGRNLPLLLSHIKISFIIKEISILEAYMLKRFCNGEMIDIETYMDDNKVNINKYPITNRNVQTLITLNNTIDSDDDVSVKPGVMLFPAKCVEKKCIVTFQGSSVLSILGTITRHPDCFFVKVNTYLADNANGRSKEEIINDLLIEGLIKEFYSFMTRKIQYMDLLTDATLDTCYLSHARNAENTLVSLAHINSIYGDIPFINIDSDSYRQILTTIKNNKETISIQNKKIPMETTEVFFVCNTTFYTFMELFLYLPIGCVQESTDIKAIYSSTDFIIPQELSKYKSRITTIIGRLKDERISVSNENSVDNYNLIELNTRIQYTVKFKLSEASNILMSLEDRIIKDHMYGEDNNYLAREILKMVSIMKNFSIASYKTIVA
jgi:hypothetical protein